MELLLSREEFVYALNSIGGKYIAGMTLPEFDLPKKKFEAVLDNGLLSLQERALINSSNGNEYAQLNPEIKRLISAIAFRTNAFVMVRGIRDKGGQLFVWNLYEDLFVEHTLPKEKQHRLMVISDIDELFHRLSKIAIIQPVLQENRPKISIDQPTFESIQSEVLDGNKDAINQLSQKGLQEDLFKFFKTAFITPDFTLSIAALSIDQHTVTNASSVSIFADDSSSWGIWPEDMEAEPPLIQIFPTGINDLRSAFVDWLDLREELN